MNPDVLFDISTANYHWWFCWPLLLIPLVTVFSIAAVCYALSDSLPTDARGILQNLCFYGGWFGAAMVLAAVGLFVLGDWVAQRRLSLHKQHGNLTVIEGRFVLGRLRGNGSPGMGGSAGWETHHDPMTFKIVDAEKAEREFDWNLARGHSATAVWQQARPGDRIRVSFASNPKSKVQRALYIEKLSDSP
jgi:hypothetical protein